MENAFVCLFDIFEQQSIDKKHPVVTDSILVQIILELLDDGEQFGVKPCH